MPGKDATGAGDAADPAAGDAAGAEAGAGWWAVADRAVRDASAAVSRAEQALAAAARRVRAARGGGELDHTRRWPDGPTSAANLTGFCTPHHRGKHQAPGWHYALGPDGVLTVTTPPG